MRARVPLPDALANHGGGKFYRQWPLAETRRKFQRLLDADASDALGEQRNRFRLAHLVDREGVGLRGDCSVPRREQARRRFSAAEKRAQILPIPYVVYDQQAR